MGIVSLLIIFFLIALVYSSVGFGGGSSYIAILLLSGAVVEEVRFTALLCNIIVVSGSSYHYVKSNLIPWKEILPFILISVPLAFIGGIVRLEEHNFKILAGIALILAAAAMFIKVNLNHKTKSSSKITLAGIGGAIGFLSGLIGIGGGIFLAPILHIMQWNKAKIISATSCVFILVNSLAGMGGQLSQGISVDVHSLLYFGLVVFLGGQIGNRLNIKYFSAHWIRIITALLVASVGIRILLMHI